jgi:Uma2 family endonuclease
LIEKVLRDNLPIAPTHIEMQLNSTVDEAKRVLVKNFPLNQAHSRMIQLTENLAEQEGINKMITTKEPKTAQTQTFAELLTQLPEASEINLSNRTWKNYEEILESVGEASGLRISYDGKNIKIMTLSVLHEKYVRFVERLVNNLSIRKKIKLISFGSATMKVSEKERGSEPDCCFYVQNAELVAKKDSIDFSKDVPPDIVVEIDIHHASTAKFDIYSKLEVPEFWLFDGKRLIIYVLDGGSYRATKKSVGLPMLTDEILSDFLGRLEDKDQFEVLMEFEEWLEKN